MKIVGFDALTATLDLDPTDCLALADACGQALRYDFPGDTSLVRALRAALEACAVIAATDTLRDGNVPESGMLDDTRKVWGLFDTSGCGKPRVVERPR
jgi:hypothetical protein